MVSFEVVVHNEFSDRVSKRISTKENHLLQTAFFDRADEALRMCVQIRRPRRQFNGFKAGDSQYAQKFLRIERISIVNQITLPCKKAIDGIRQIAGDLTHPQPIR